MNIDFFWGGCLGKGGGGVGASELFSIVMIYDILAILIAAGLLSAI